MLAAAARPITKKATVVVVRSFLDLFVWAALLKKYAAPTLIKEVTSNVEGADTQDKVKTTNKHARAAPIRSQAYILGISLGNRVRQRQTIMPL